MRRISRSITGPSILLLFALLQPLGLVNECRAQVAATAPAVAPAAVATDNESYLRLHYTKEEHAVPMRDGTKLFTAIYRPRDTSKTYPILMKRTPYSCSPYCADKFPAAVGPSEHFPRAGYIFVNQDVRGRFMSEGEFQQVTPHLTEKRLRRGIFPSVPQLIDAICNYVEAHNDDPRPVVWTKTAQEIIGKVGRARIALIRAQQAASHH